MPFEHREHVAVDDQQLAIRHRFRAGAALFAVDAGDFADDLAGMNDGEDFLAGRRQRDDFDAALLSANIVRPGEPLAKISCPAR
jgi:hypothetical protein